MFSFGHIGQELWKPTPRWLWGLGFFFFFLSKCQWLQVDSEQILGSTLFILVWHGPLLCRQEAHWHFLPECLS